MTADVELPPCPFCGEKLHEYEHSFVHPHPSPAHGFCLIAGLSFRRDQLDFWNRRATAARDAEIEALRAEVALLRVGAENERLHQRGLLDRERERAERLAEVLQKAGEYINGGTPSWASGGQGVLAIIRAALNPTATQEESQ